MCPVFLLQQGSYFVVVLCKPVLVFLADGAQGLLSCCHEPGSKSVPFLAHVRRRHGGHVLGDLGDFPLKAVTLPSVSQGAAVNLL